MSLRSMTSAIAIAVAVLATTTAAGAQEPPPVAIETGVRGRVTDAKTGEGLIEATVKVIKGGRGQAVTDVDGYFELELAPGSYELRVYNELYQGRKISGVEVVKGDVETIDVALEPDSGAVQEVVVEEKADPRSEGAQLTVRKKAPVVQDTVSAQEISRSPDSSAGDAVKRVPSATVVGGKYVFVRGLGGRYSITLLNGVVLPSPDPDNPSVPLDLFPASLLANLTVVKSYMADLPGTFSGGALLIETNAYPERFELKLKVGVGYDSTSTFADDMLTYSGGSYDWLGFDSGRRGLPDAVPGDRSVDGLTPEENAAAGRAFDDVWDVETRTATPNLSLSGQVGGTTVLAGDKRLGYLATVTYGQKLAVRTYEARRVALSGGEVVETDQADIDQGEENVTWGALANVGLEWNKHSQVSAFWLWSRAAEDRTLRDEGYSSSDGTDYRKIRLAYQTRQLSFVQVSGRHEFTDGHDAELRWQSNFALTSRDEPDTRDLYYLRQEDSSYLFVAQPLSGERFFGDLDDVSGGGGLELTLPWSRFTLKTGVGAQATSRNFDARRLGYKFIGDDYAVLSMPDPEDMLAGHRFGTDWRLEERTQADDSYAADRSIFSAYAFGDLKVTKDIRLIAGIRLEAADQTISTGSPLLPGVMFEDVTREDVDLLPGVAVVYGITARMNLRGSWSRTLARPQFRELAPFLYYDFTRRRSVTGNPELVNTTIQNADLRWEWFFADKEVIAASVFYKSFQDPIELVIKNPNGDGLYENSTEADVYGFELELRGNFGRLARPLEKLRGAANLTVIDSTVDMTGATGSFSNSKRPLQGQSPYVLNLDLGWSDEERGFELSLLYNVYGERLADVGTSGLPDVYEGEFHRVDISASKKLGSTKLKLTGTNLLNQDVVLEQGPVVVQRYAPGVVLGASLEWAL